MLIVTLVVAVISTALLLILASAVMTYFKLRGTRLITCPETKKTAAVEVNARRAAFLTPTRVRDLRLKDCSRWPERKNCGQECLREIELSPEDCLVRTILTKWYAGKRCALCSKTFGQITWLDYKPALMSPGKPSRDFSDIPPLEIPHALEVAMPVCFDCHVAADFRHRYPELIVDRSWPGQQR
jgi:hypothetical protein